MRVRFWGVRGSIPTPGRHTVRYGGNTSCVQVLPDDGALIIVDAGTGIRKLGKHLMAGACGEGRGRVHLLISHTHWDHIQGLPFFAPSYREGNQITVYARERNDSHLRLVLSSATRDPYFPVPFDAVQATVRFAELREGDRFEVGASTVTCSRLNHPFVALAYRVEEAGRAVAYVSDTAPFTDILLEDDFVPAPPAPEASLTEVDERRLARMRDDLVALCQGCSLVIYDVMFTMAEYRQRPHWGHSAPEHAIEILRRAEVGRLVMYHHAPTRSDEAVDAILEAARRSAPELEILAATEGMTLTV